MSLPVDPRLPLVRLDEPYLKALNTRLFELFREISRSINRGAMWCGEGVGAPTTGEWSQGDKYKNSSPSESGAASSKYVTLGWVCTVSGTPGTWLPIRTLTGN